MNGEMKVGLFVLVGAILLGSAVFLLGDYSLQKFYTVNAEFSDVAGLPDKAIVKLSGVEVGKIKRIYLRDNTVIVELGIFEGVKIYRNAKFLVGSTSMIGSKFLQIDQGVPSAGRLEPGDTVQGENALPLDRALAKAVDSLEGLIEDVRGEGRLARDIKEILANMRDTSADLKGLVADARPHVQQTAEHAESTARRADEIAKKLESLVERADGLVAKIEKGEGVAGALVSDAKMKEEVSAAITNIKDASASAKDALGRVTGFRTYLNWDYKYEPLAHGSKNNFGVKIYPREHRYYYLGGANMVNNKDRREGTDYETLNTIDAQLGWEVGRFDFYAGALRGSGGAGVKWRPVMNPKWDRFTVLFEGSEFGRDRKIKGRGFNDPRFDAGVDVKVNKYVSAGMRVNDVLETKRVNYTTKVLFEDKDIAYLFGFATLGVTRK